MYRDWHKLDSFEQAYFTCLIWSTNDESTEAGGEPLDKNYGWHDFDDTAQQRIIDDCRMFREQAGDLLSGLNEEQCGHDFWLTRNGHGAGFWDRGLGDLGQKLTDAAHSFGEQWTYIGDDGKVYIS